MEIREKAITATAQARDTNAHVGRTPGTKAARSETCATIITATTAKEQELTASKIGAKTLTVSISGLTIKINSEMN